MSTFKSSERIIAADRVKVYQTLQNPANFGKLANNVPEEVKSQVDGIRIDGDTITISAKPVGDISFKIVKGVVNEQLHLETVSSPMPFGIDVCLSDEVAGVSTRVYTAIDIDLNPIVKSMFSKPLQMAVEKFADLVSSIPYDKL